MSKESAFVEAIKQGDLAAVQRAAAEAPLLLKAGDSKETSPLLLSVYHGKTAVTEWLLAQEIGPLSIWEAAAVGDLERVQALIEANPNLSDAHAADGFTPLGLAAFFGHVSTLTFLLEHGADANVAAKNRTQVRPIHSAAAHRAPDVALAMVQYLLAYGADANVAQHGGWTPLHQAANHGHAALVRLLLEHEADATVRSDDGRLPLDLAREQGFDEIVSLLQ